MSNGQDFSKVTTELLGHNEFSVDENEIIYVNIGSGKLEKYTSAVDLKGWYNDLHDTLVYNKVVRFVDMQGTEKDMKKGDFIEYIHKFGEHIDADSYQNRTGDMFEVRFHWNKPMPDLIELELEWKARAPMNDITKIGNTSYGWFEFKLDLVNRMMKEKEYVVNGETKKFLVGSWEFRNRYAYKNKIIPELLNKIPLVKNNGRLKAMIINYFYLRLLEKDVDIVERELHPLINNQIKKFFLNET